MELQFRVIVKKEDNKVLTGLLDDPNTKTFFNSDVYYMVVGSFENGYQRLLDAGADINEEEYEQLMQDAVEKLL